MGVVKKAVKKTFKAAKKIARKAEDALLPKFARKISAKIRGVASKIWLGIKKKVIKPVLGAIGKVTNTLGPIGMIAMSFVLPGIGTMLSGMWSSAATTLGQSGIGWMEAVGKGMEWASKAATQTFGGEGGAFGDLQSKFAETSVGQKVQGISEQISDTFTKIGGDVKTGAENLFQSAKDFVAGDTSKVANIGQTVGQNAINSATQQTMAANPELLRAAGGNIVKAQKLIQEQNVFLREGQTAFIGETGNALNENPELFRATGDVNKAKKLAGEQIDFLGESADSFAGLKPAAEKAAKSTLKDKLIDTALKSFTTPPLVAPEFIPLAGNKKIEDVTANRLGVGGTGAAGGTFLDQSILAQIQAQSKRLEEIG